MKALSIFSFLLLMPDFVSGQVVIREPMRLTSAQHKSLLTSVIAQAHENLDVIETRIFKPLRPSYPEPYAEVVLGPYEKDDNSFVLDIVVCTAPQGAFSWNCNLQSVRQYFYIGSIESSFELSQNISEEIALSIYEEALQNCNLAFGRTYTSKPKITGSPNEVGKYFLTNSNCNYEFFYSSGVATIGQKLRILQ